MKPGFLTLGEVLCILDLSILPLSLWNLYEFDPKTAKLEKDKRRWKWCLFLNDSFKMATAGKLLLNFRHSWGQADSWAVIYERSQNPGSLL